MSLPDSSDDCSVSIGAEDTGCDVLISEAAGGGVAAAAGAFSWGSFFGRLGKLSLARLRGNRMVVEVYEMR